MISRRPAPRLRFLGSRRAPVRLLFALILALPTAAAAQRGDVLGEAQPETWRRFEIPAAPPLSPEEARATFRLAPGFRVELVAAEPLVVDPVAIAWDADGRLWAVEMRGYMPTVEGEGETAPVGQVVVLEDLDSDGAMDRSTVFLSGLVNPRAILPVGDGVLVGVPPDLWYARDLDGDLRCDEKSAVAPYGNPDPDAVEHTENGLLLALDNRIYNAKSKRRFLFHSGELEEEETLHRGQWGIAQDDRGRLYYNGNSNYLFGDSVPAEYVAGDPGATPPVSPVSPVARRIVSDEGVHSIRVNPGINRGYRRHMLRPDGRLARTTAVSGLTIYRGDQYPPAFRGDAFVPEPAGNVVAHFRFVRTGLTPVAEQRLVNDSQWGERAFLASTDERFRPVSCAVGPDGCLYIVDMYRGIIQHRRYVTSFLRQQILERGLDRPVGLGRIWRIVAEGRPVRRSPPALTRLALEDLWRTLDHPSGWHRDRAQRLLGRRSSLEVVRAAERSRGEPCSWRGRVHRVWTWEALGEPGGVADALRDPDPRVRQQALRAAEGFVGVIDSDELVRALTAGIEDADVALRVQSWLTLGAISGEAPRLADLWSTRLAQARDPWERFAVLAGSRGRELGALRSLLEAESCAPPLVEELAAAALRRDRKRFSDLIECVAEYSDHPLAGRIVDGVLGIVSTPGAPPLRARRTPSLFRRLDLDPALLRRLDRLRSVVVWEEENAPPPPLSAADIGRMSAAASLVEVCAQCHGENGEGSAVLAPPLAESPWVVGNEERLIRIVLHGLTGPLRLGGRLWDLEMPGHGNDPRFDDDSLAGLLTFLRRQWGNIAPPVQPETVRRVRQETRGRRAPWTVEELREIP